jgi:leucyl aminopeptidase
MDIAFVAAAEPAPLKTAIARLVFEGETPADLGRALAASRFNGAKGQTLDILAPEGVAADRLVLVGAGKRDAYSGLAAEHAAATAYNVVKTSGLAALRIEGAGAFAADAALGVRLASYRFDRYRTKEAAEKKPTVTAVQVVANDPDAARAAFRPLSAIADGVTFTRDLVSEPPNVLFPTEFASRVKALETLGLEVEVLGEAEMSRLGMGSLLAVGQGSIRDSQLVVIRWNGASDPNAQPIAFVGKGVCFDTGGISIKPADGMEDMKWDMGGAGAVAGLMHALAGRKAKVNAVGILGLVENMPDGNAYRPGDVLTSMSGQTIEVINTDAEGRLVLADALWYCQDRFKPKFMIDLATLTGAIIIALGHDYAGLFSNNDELSGKLEAAGKGENEQLWRLPLPAAYEKQFDSMAADMKNVGGRPGGSITAALILQKFVAGVPWAHLDIAGVAWRKPSHTPTVPDGASGFGVRLLNRLVADNYED